MPRGAQDTRRYPQDTRDTRDTGYGCTRESSMGAIQVRTCAAPPWRRRRAWGTRRGRSPQPRRAFRIEQDRNGKERQQGKAKQGAAVLKNARRVHSARERRCQHARLGAPGLLGHAQASTGKLGRLGGGDAPAPPRLRRELVEQGQHLRLHLQHRRGAQNTPCVLKHAFATHIHIAQSTRA